MPLTHQKGQVLPFSDVEILLVSGTVSDYCHSDYPPYRLVSDAGDYKLYTRLKLVTIQPEHAPVVTVSLREEAKKSAKSGPCGHTVISPVLRVSRLDGGRSSNLRKSPSNFCLFTSMRRGLSSPTKATFTLGIPEHLMAVPASVEARPQSVHVEPFRHE